MQADILYTQELVPLPPIELRNNLTLLISFSQVSYLFAYPWCHLRAQAS